MRIGVGRLMQNYLDLDSMERGHASTGVRVSDATVYDEELALAGLIEPLGFNSIWTTEHYFSPYQITGSALQQATFMAGRTNRVGFGTMVLVLPWHHPLLVATEICVLDNMLAGRRLTLGLGRGLTEREFDTFGVPLTETKGRFFEAVEIIQLALTQEWFSYDGKFYKVPEASIRPRPRNPERLIADMRIASPSAAVLPAGANPGLDIITFLPRIDRGSARKIDAYNAARVERGEAPSRPVLFAFVACTEDDAEGRALINRHVREVQASAIRFRDSNKSNASGFGGKLYTRARNAARRLAQALGRETYPETQIWGSPQRCLDRLAEIHSTLDPAEVIVCFKFGSLPHTTAEKSMRLFAEKVLPVVQQWMPAKQRAETLKSES